jgi:catechol-2,3-dioxygenase
MSASQSTPTVSSIDSDFATFGAVHLDVTDLDRALGFWRDLIGLQELSRSDEVTVLGVPGRPLVATGRQSRVCPVAPSHHAGPHTQ